MPSQARKRVTVEVDYGTVLVAATAETGAPPRVAIRFLSPVLVPETFVDADSARSAASRLEAQAADLRRAAEGCGQLCADASEQAQLPAADLLRRGPHRAPRPPIGTPPAVDAAASPPSPEPRSDARDVAPNRGASQAPDAAHGNK
jgi:hypothetical protein